MTYTYVVCGAVLYWHWHDGDMLKAYIYACANQR